MNQDCLLTVDGQVNRPLSLSFSDLAAVAEDGQFADVGRIDPKRKGDAVKLSALLDLAGVKPSADYLGLHGSADDFHASIPIEAVRDRALLIYRHEGSPLATKDGGPVRFYVRDFATCQTDEVDECANVKFLDRIELTAGKGFDNRPIDEESHKRLHGQSGN